MRQSAYAAASPSANDRARGTCPPRDASPPTTTPASAPRPRSSPANVAATRPGTNPPTAQPSTPSTSHHAAPATRPAPSPHIMPRTRILGHRSHRSHSGKSAAPAFAGRGTPLALSTGHHSRCPPPTRDAVSGRQLISGSEAPDHVEGRAAPALVDGDRHADAEEAPEEDLDGRVVEGVEVAHRDQEADARGEDRPQHEPEPPVGDRARTAADRRQRRADHPHHERPADEPRALHEGEVHVLVAHQAGTRRALAVAIHLDPADGALAR